MIQNHKLKYENGEEVLYLYLDFSYEFSKELGEFSSSIFSSIKNYLKRLKKEFNGKKVVIVCSGIIIATLSLNVGMMKENKVTANDDILYITSVHFENPNIEKAKIEEKEEEVKNEQNASDSVQKETKVEKQKETNESSHQNKPTSTKKNNGADNKTTKSKSSVPKTTKKTTTNTATKKVAEQTTKNETKQTNGTIVTVYRSNGQVLKIELEEYIIGVVAAEMPASFKSEALKAQAVLARTYALKNISQNKKLTDSTSTQVYNDNNQLKNKWGSEYSKYYNKIKNAVASTKGQVVTYNGSYIEALYHAISNGYTEDSKNIWGNSFSYLKTVESSFDKNVSGYMKTVSKTYKELTSKLGITIDSSSEINIEKNASNRVSTITINDKSFTGVEFRTKLGLRSADFDIEKTKTGFNITTRGFGHGVGMSQYGANEMAKSGKTYKQIIEYYYNGVTIKAK